MFSFERTHAVQGRMIDLDMELQRFAMMAMFSVFIDLDSPSGEIAGRPGLFEAMLRTQRRRNRAKRYSRSPTWRFRARRNRLVI